MAGPALAVQRQLNFSRDMEREADRVGYGVMTDAGYEAQGFVTMFEKLQQAARLNDNGSFPYLRSHPMTTERIADAQARQQLLPTRAAVATTPTHAMMSARAQVLAKPGVDVLRTLAGQAHATTLALATPAKQAGVLYGATMAEMVQRNFGAARQHLARLQSLAGLELSALCAVRLLAAELALTAGDAAQAVVLLTPKVVLLASQDRATRMQLARSRIATQKPAQGKLAASELSLWLSQHPRDASAWLLQASAYELQGDSLRAIRAQAEARAMELLHKVGVAARAEHRPAALSGGEQQRVAFCRALANKPRLLLADEPTGNLDPATSDQVFAALMVLVRETGLAALIATHIDLGIAAEVLDLAPFKARAPQDGGAKGAFDELCLVRATGNCVPDNTIELAEK